jgi:two-component system, NarL family, sensor kinase
VTVATAVDRGSKQDESLDQLVDNAAPLTRWARVSGAGSIGNFSARRFFIRFLLSSVIVVALVAMVTAVASRRAGNREAIADARRMTNLAAHGIAEPNLTMGVLEGDPDAVEEFDELISTRVVNAPLVRVKMWTVDGRIVYSDNGELIGSTFPLDEEELAIIESGEIRADISGLDKSENELEQAFDSLVEVYVPIVGPDGEPIVFEAYYDYASVTEAGRKIWLAFAPIALGGLLLIQLVHVPLAWMLALKVERSQRERERLFRHALESSDAERRRIASDLHDGVVQDLTGVSYALAAAARRSPGSPDDEVTTSASARLREAIRSLRSLLVEIYPPNLHEEGLDSALSDLLAKLQLRGMQTQLTVDVDSEELGEDTIRLLYRGAQEALRNVVAHADARSVHVRVAPLDKTSIVLTVTDDGKGFDPAAPAESGHVGLTVLAGIVADAGGEVSVASSPGHGTTARIEMPLR